MNYSPIINGKNILITGGTGSFGRQLVKEISGLSPKHVVIYSRDEDKQYSMKQDLSLMKKFLKEYLLLLET